MKKTLSLNSTVELTSINYAELLKYLAYTRHKVVLNNTQVNKLLFMCYGCVLALTGKQMFTDDTPKAWPYGPVFPKVFKRYTPDVHFLSEKEKDVFRNNPDTLRVCTQIVDKYHILSAYQLSVWSHQENGPWYKTVNYNKKDGKVQWNKVIPDELIKSYFKDEINA